MCDEVRLPAKPEPNGRAQPSGRQRMESVLDLLRQENTSDRQLNESLSELGASLERHITASEVVAAYEDAVLRAPWLTSERERLRQQQMALRQSLQAIILCLRRGVGSRQSAQQLFQQMQDVAELYVEYDVAEQNFFETAFPGPDWAI